MARKKVTAEPVLKDWQAVNAALSALRELAANQADAQATLDEAVEEVRARYEPDMAGRKAQILRIEKDLQEFTEAHKEELEATEGRRSKQLPNGTVGFRRSTELTTLPKTTWKDVTERLTEAGRRWLKLLRVKREPNKDAIRDAGLEPEVLERFGMRVREKDTFGYTLESTESAAMVPIDEGKRTAG